LTLRCRWPSTRCPSSAAPVQASGEHRMSATAHASQRARMHTGPASRGAGARCDLGRLHRPPVHQ
jgi:hypothetical protein